MPVFLQIHLAPVSTAVNKLTPYQEFNQKIEKFREPTNAMPDVPDPENENVGDEVKEQTINGSITYPDQTSSCTTESFVERKDDIDCEDGADNAVAPEKELSIDQNLFAKQTEGSLPEVAPSTDSKHTSEEINEATEVIKEASVLWSPRLLLAISIVLVSCCSNVIFLELLVRQVFPTLLLAISLSLI